MPTLSQLSESDILNRVGKASFERGRRYYRNGAIVNPRRRVTSCNCPMVLSD